MVTEQPNVLFIMTDQQTLRAMSVAGNKYVHTPNMDALASRGVRFEKSYCTSPVCGPSRSSLVTGRMPHETGVNFNSQSIDSSILNLGQVFRKAGYKTAWAGKWHLPRSYPTTDEFTGFDYLRVASTGNSGGEVDSAVADKAIKFLKTGHKKPFLLVVSLHNPHDICHWNSGNAARFGIDHPKVDLFPQLPDNFDIDPNEPEFIDDCRNRVEYGAINRVSINWSDVQWRAYLRVYYACVERVDAVLGRVLNALDSCGLNENTLIVFTSDHGNSCAGHRLIGKLNLYDESATVPMVVSFPGKVPQGVVNKTCPVSGIDVLPTICDYGGVETPNGVQGKSFRSTIDNPGSFDHRFVICELHPFPDNLYRCGRMVRTADFKYVVFSDGLRPEMLFNMKSDRGEMNNLVDDLGHRKELIRHRKLLSGWVKDTNDTFFSVSYD